MNSFASTRSGFFALTLVFAFAPGCALAAGDEAPTANGPSTSRPGAAPTADTAKPTPNRAPELGAWIVGNAFGSSVANIGRDGDPQPHPWSQPVASPPGKEVQGDPQPHPWSPPDGSWSVWITPEDNR